MNEFDSRPEVVVTTCPICGGPNHCALAIDPKASDCWCENLDFPQQLLEQVPAEALHQTCICRACRDQFTID